MEKKRSDHWQLGYGHRRAGLPRYKFIDPYLQQQYNDGWQAANDGEEHRLPRALVEELRKMQEEQQRKKW